jgi:hypothetical protein
MTPEAKALSEGSGESSSSSEKSPEPLPKKSQFTRQNAIIIGAYFLSLIAVVCLSYFVMVLWLPAWFPPSVESPFEFPHFTYTSEEQVTTGEPVNLVILADDGGQIVDVFQKAGLIQVGSVGEQSLKTTIVDALEKRITPISQRYMLGRAQDYAFQSHSDSVAHRHHLRVWRYEDHTWDGKPIWLVSASYDQGLGLTLAGFVPMPTHLVSPNLDDERDYLAELFIHHGAVSRHSHAPGVGPIPFRSNGDLSFYYTDGQVAVLTVGEPADGKPEIVPLHWSLRVRSKYFDVPTLFLQFLGLAHVYESPSAILREIEDAVQ